jgi:transposase
MSGEWKRSKARLVRHRRPKGPATDRPNLNHRATPRLYTFRFPEAKDGRVAVTPAEMAALLEGIDLTRARRLPRDSRPAPQPA